MAMFGTDNYEGKTYATRENAIKAFHRVFGTEPTPFNWFIAVNIDGRFYPVCIGERALQFGTHYHFCTTN